MILYGYVIFYFVTALHAYKKIKPIPESDIKRRFVALIPARNEAGVIGNLIKSLQNQNYPKDLYDIVIIPNNCTDNTKEVALEMGAKVLECRGDVKSKGEVLSDIFDQLVTNYSDTYDGAIIFDADNLVHPDFILKINDAYNDGAKVCQGYRASKNPSDTWISGCHSIYYYIVNGFFDRARMALGWSAALNGTGFMVSMEILKKHEFKTYSMTEDIEYTSIVISEYGENIKWVPEAITYDEQPLKFSESVTQRFRWTVGTVQCFNRYAGKLFVNTFKKKSMPCFDMLVLYSAAYMQLIGLVPTFMAVFTFFHMMIMSILESYLLWFLFGTIISGVVCYAASMFVAYLVLKLEKKDVHTHRKAVFGFGLFLLSWLPISLWALVKQKCKWKEIKHTRNVSVDDVIKA